MKLILLASTALLPVIVLGGCARTGDLDASGGVSAVRSACPIVGVPAGTGDVTLFDPPTSQAETAIDVVANMTQVRGTCDDAGTDIGTTVNFVVQARRTRYDAARDVDLPYYVAVVRAGNQVVAKQVGAVRVHFDSGQPRAQASGTATTTVSRAEATLPQEIRDRLTRRRKAGDEDAAVDPLSQPEVRTAVAKATFEALVGFQLNDNQLRYNATR